MAERVDVGGEMVRVCEDCGVGFKAAKVYAAHRSIWARRGHCSRNHRESVMVPPGIVDLCRATPTDEEESDHG